MKCVLKSKLTAIVLRNIFIVVAAFRFDVVWMKEWEMWRCSPSAHIPLLNVRQLSKGWVDGALAPPRGSANLLLLS